MFLRVFILLIIMNVSLPSLAQSETPFEIENEGWELKGDLRLPEGDPKGLVLMFHKAAGNRGEYLSLATRLEMAGFASLRVDLRGHGDSINIDVFDYEVRKNNEILDGTERDIAAVQNWVKLDPRFKDIPIFNISGSYSGEMAVLASDLSGYMDGYIQLSPGSLSDESMMKVDPSGVPWLFVMGENERSFFIDIFKGIEELAPTAERWVLEGVGREGHATRMFIGHPEIEIRLVDWIKGVLKTK